MSGRRLNGLTKNGKGVTGLGCERFVYRQPVLCIMVIKSAELETVCGITSTLPKNSLPEFAFAGKSNVGKSSMINALVNRKALARTSGQPGKTQTINYYNVNKSLYFVDLPGYGYAKVSKEIKEKWGKMIEKYLRTSKVLKKVFLLVDIRHEPGENDKLMYEWIVANGFEPVIIATKLDKITRSAVQHNIKIIRTSLKAKAGTVIIPFSSLSKQGVDDIWKLLNDTVDGEKNAEENGTLDNG